MERKIYLQRLEYDALRATAELIKKDQGVNPSDLSNRKKAQVIDALRTHYPLKALLLTFDMAKSSYCYQGKVNRLADKYALLKQRMRELFEQNRSCYGYRRLH